MKNVVPYKKTCVVSLKSLKGFKRPHVLVKQEQKPLTINLLKPRK